MTRHEITAVIARWQDAMARRDATAVMANYAEDCVVDSPTAGGPVRGRDANEQILRVWFTAFPDLTFHDEGLLVDDNRVAKIVTVAGTDSGSFMGLPATGKPFRCSAVFLFTLNQEQKIEHERRITDFTGILMQIGALKAKPA